MAAERIRIEVAFEGGQAFSTLVELDAADALERALTGSDEFTTVDGDDGSYLVALRRVSYLKRFARESRVGFGSQ